MSTGSERPLYFPNFLTENSIKVDTISAEYMKDRAVTKGFAWLCEVGGGRYSTALL